jgi:hypothetical protein
MIVCMPPRPVMYVQRMPGAAREVDSRHQRRAGERGREIQFARTPLRERDQFLDVGHRQARMAAQHVRRKRERHDRCQIAQVVERRLGLRKIGDQHRAHVRHQQRVAVGLRARNEFSADQAGSTRPRFEQDLLPPLLGHFLADQPAQDVGSPAGRVRRDETDRARGISLRRIDRRGLRVNRRRQYRGSRDHSAPYTVRIHYFSSCLFDVPLRRFCAAGGDD